MIKGYIPKEQRKKILLICDDIRVHSGIATMAKEIVVGTAHHYNWINLAAAIQHPEIGKAFDLSEDTNRVVGIDDSSVFLYPIDGYGTQELVRHFIQKENPDAIMIFTDPRYWTWLFQIENEIRQKIPLIYLSIWDSLPAPLYNKAYYESCDSLLCISKQTKAITELVLGDISKNRVIKYVPHGINEKHFYPINEFMSHDQNMLDAMKSRLFANKDYEFVLLYNARNIRRKCVPDLIAAWSLFCDKIGKDKASKTALLLHTQALDENGTDLPAVIDLLCADDHKTVIINEDRLATADMNLLYNACDGVALVSSNEGWGLSLTEAMMAGKPIIATVTGGMQDQMRFENESGEWLDLTTEFPSNHFGTYKTHGDWAYPVYPSNLSLVGSIPTPYIFDDRADFREIAEQIDALYQTKTTQSETYANQCAAARSWVTSDESMMSARKMSENVIDGIDDTFETWTPRANFEFIKIESLAKKTITHNLTY
jgi:glycosyltransferase involved in cell wall biosynthesis